MRLKVTLTGSFGSDGGICVMQVGCANRQKVDCINNVASLILDRSQLNLSFLEIPDLSRPTGLGQGRSSARLLLEVLHSSP